MVAGAFGARHHVVIHYVVTYSFFGFGLCLFLWIGPLLLYWLWPLLVLWALAPVYIKGRLF